MSINRPRRMTAASVSMAAIAAVLLSVLALQLLTMQGRAETRTWNQSLASALPSSNAVFDAQDLPLAETETLKQRVENILRFDDVLYRRYQLRGTTRWLELYVAYWAPESVTLQEAGQHTPDTCWVNSGWERAEKRSGFIFDIQPVKLRPAEVGLFTKDRTRLHVAFWHIVGGKLHRYDQLGWDDGISGFFSRLPNAIRDWRLYGLNQRQEQVFVRIHSNEPLEKLLAEPAFNDLLRSLAPLGVTLDQPRPPGPA